MANPTISKQVMAAYAMLRATWLDRMNVYEKDRVVKAAFLKQLASIPPDLLIPAIESLCATRDTLYTGDNIVALIRGQIASQALGSQQGSHEVIEWIRVNVPRLGRNYAGGFPSEAIADAVRQAGGWEVLCNSSPESFDIRLNRVRKSLEERTRETKLQLMRDPQHAREMLEQSEESRELIEDLSERRKA